MTSNPHQRALCLNDQGTPVVTSPASAGAKGQAAQPCRASRRDATARRKPGQSPALHGVSMDYQQGFFSGPSS